MLGVGLVFLLDDAIHGAVDGAIDEVKGWSAEGASCGGVEPIDVLEDE